jgi:hypothetical protein
MATFDARRICKIRASRAMPRKPQLVSGGVATCFAPIALAIRAIRLSIFVLSSALKTCGWNEFERLRITVKRSPKVFQETSVAQIRRGEIVVALDEPDVNPPSVRARVTFDFKLDLARPHRQLMSAWTLCSFCLIRFNLNSKQLREQNRQNNLIGTRIDQSPRLD